MIAGWKRECVVVKGVYIYIIISPKLLLSTGFNPADGPAVLWDTSVSPQKLCQPVTTNERLLLVNLPARIKSRQWRRRVTPTLLQASSLFAALMRFLLVSFFSRPLGKKRRDQGTALIWFIFNETVSGVPPPFSSHI